MHQSQFLKFFAALYYVSIVPNNNLFDRKAEKTEKKTSFLKNINLSVANKPEIN